MSLPRVPGDAELCDMIRAGLNTTSALAHKIYGYPTERNFRSLKDNVRVRLVSMEKFGIVRRHLTVTPASKGQQVYVWEVIE